MIKKTLCLLVLLAVIQSTSAQEARTNKIENNFWFTLGTGYSVPVNSLPVLYTSVTYNYKNNLTVGMWFGYTVFYRCGDGMSSARARLRRRGRGLPGDA